MFSFKIAVATLLIAAVLARTTRTAAAAQPGAADGIHSVFARCRGQIRQGDLNKIALRAG